MTEGPASPGGRWKSLADRPDYDEVSIVKSTNYGDSVYFGTWRPPIAATAAIALPALPTDPIPTKAAPPGMVNVYSMCNLLLYNSWCVLEPLEDITRLFFGLFFCSDLQLKVGNNLSFSQNFLSF